MKKFFSFFVIMFGVNVTAMAVPVDYKASDGFLCAKVDRELYADGSFGTGLQGQNSKIQLFFDKGSSTAIGLHDGCEAEYRKIYSDLKKVAGDVEELVFIGSADEQNASGHFDNRDLAERRAEYAHQVIGGGFSYMKYVTGDEDARTWSPTIDNQMFRAVNVYVVWRLAKCPPEFVNNLGKYEQELTSAISKYPNEKAKLEKALAGVKEAKGICKSGKTLVASQVERLLDVYGLLVIAGNIVPEVHITNTEVGIDILRVESNIDAQYSSIARLRGELGLSEWRDENGNFNTARLLSDSVAGVVLGTVGGIVTSKLVKKNQLKKGFEDLSCTVGGQRVADYGDDFTVGLR